MEIWIWTTLVAATTQTLRSAGQKQMKSVMGDFGASYIRFSYALPFACIWLYAVMSATGQAMPQTTSDFWLWVSIGGMTQVIFTVLLITLFNHRNFAAGTAFSKTEILQAAIFEAIIIGEFVSFQVGLAIAIGVFAILMLSFHKAKIGIGGIRSAVTSYHTLLGFGSWRFSGPVNRQLSGGNRCACDRRCIGTRLHVGGYLYPVANAGYGHSHDVCCPPRAYRLFQILAQSLASWPVWCDNNCLLVYRLFDAECCLCAGNRAGRAFDNPGRLCPLF